MLIPDLLHPTPTPCVKFEPTELAISLAFAGGTSGGMFSDALQQAPIAASNWQPASFVKDLFLTDFVSSCFRIKIGDREPSVMTRHLVRLLAHPPSDPNIVQFRRGIVSELMGSEELRQQLELLYQDLCLFRSELEGLSGTSKLDANRRQLDILASVKSIIQRMAAGFSAAQSGLSRLNSFGQRVQATEEFQSLVDLLRFDEQCATLTIRAGIGADGRIRRFEVQSIEEDQTNAFVSPPWQRWMARIELFARGFNFSEGEIMARLLDAVFSGVRAQLVCFVQLMGDIEFYLGALGFRDRARAAGLEVCVPEFNAPGEGRSLLGLFNPLLLGHGVVPVPCDITTDRHDTTLLITGPNSGGKTRLLQSIGLAQVMAQVGLFIPARSGRVAPASGMVVSLIQETQVDQAEGRLGVELVRIRALFEQMPPGAMVILDELCSGTNPTEGEEIFELVVTMLTKLKPQAFITTHFLSFAARLKREGKIGDLRFLQVLLDPSLQPTYQFAPGVADSSLAAHAASRLGVTGEQLLHVIDQKLRALSFPSQG